MLTRVMAVFALALAVGACNGAKDVASTQVANDELSAAAAQRLRTIDRPTLVAERAERRAFEGAPPTIPHDTGALVANAQCMNCHAVGTQYGVNVLHPELTNCEQCHVMVKTDKLFVTSDFEPLLTREVEAPSNPMGPPYIPHRVQDRASCNICHTDPGAPQALKPLHGDVGNCTMCHLQLLERVPMGLLK